MQRHCQLVRCTLTISLYITFSPLSPSPFHDVTRPRVLLQQYPMRRPKVGGLFPRKETGHLLFPYSDMKRHFYFCRPPLGPQHRVVAIPTVFKILSREYQCHVRERFTGPGFEATYNMDIAPTFKEPLPFPALRSPSGVLPIFRVPLLIVLRAIQQVTLNRSKVPLGCQSCLYE